VEFFFFTHGQLKKIMSNQRHISIFAELDWRGGYPGKKNYGDANQTENFIGAETENDIYYRGEKHY